MPSSLLHVEKQGVRDPCPCAVWLHRWCPPAEKLLLLQNQVPGAPGRALLLSPRKQGDCVLDPWATLPTIFPLSVLCLVFLAVEGVGGRSERESATCIPDPSTSQPADQKAPVFLHIWLPPTLPNGCPRRVCSTKVDVIPRSRLECTPASKTTQLGGEKNQLATTF